MVFGEKLMTLGIERLGEQRHRPIRAKSDAKLRVLKRFGRRDELLKLDIFSHGRKKHP
jgi:hypothetical protein